MKPKPFIERNEKGLGIEWGKTTKKIEKRYDEKKGNSIKVFMLRFSVTHIHPSILSEDNEIYIKVFVSLFFFIQKNHFQ